MDVRIPENQRVLEYLQSSGAEGELIPAAEAPGDPYRECGSHPDVVEHLWEKIGISLGANTNYVLYGRPALVHPRTGVIMALTFGTAYILRLPTELMDQMEVDVFDAKRSWSDGSVTDLEKILGPEWFFGKWSEREIRILAEGYAPFFY